jgi:replication factor A1
MSAQRTAEVILAHRQDLTYDYVMTAIRRKKKASRGLLTDDAAARLVAAEHGLLVGLEKPTPRTYLNQVVGGLSDVTVYGRVLLACEPRVFRRTSKGGQLARLLIADRTSVLNVVLWNDKAALSTEIRPGVLVRIQHGYTKQARDGDTELHVSERGDVQINPSDAEERDFPTATELCQKVADINGTRRRTHVKGRIQTTHSTRTYERRNGTQGRLFHALLEDKTGKIPVVFWNAKAEEMTQFPPGRPILLVNARVSRNHYIGGFELHVGDFSSIEVH